MLEITAAQMRQVEADCYHCLTNMLDKAQVCSEVHEGRTPGRMGGSQEPGGTAGASLAMNCF